MPLLEGKANEILWYFGFVPISGSFVLWVWFVFLRSEQSQRGNAEEPYTAILPQ